jgi:hypothetical protein
MNAHALQDQGMAPMVNGISFFDEVQHPAGIFKSLMRDARDASVSLARLGRVVFSPSKGLYYSDVRDMAAFCRSNASTVHVAPLSRDDGMELNEDHETQARPAEELLWQAGFYASSGRLLRGLSDYHVVRLSHWPNLTRLPSTPNTMRICALLVRHSSSIGLARRLLKVSSEEMNQVLSAAAVAGALVVESAPNLPSQTVVDRSLAEHAEAAEAAAKEREVERDESWSAKGVLSLLLNKIRGL